MRRLLVSVGLVVVLAALGGAATVAPPADAGETSAAMSERPARVVAFGDSLLSEAEAYLVWVGGATGFEVRVSSLGGTAICDWFDRAVGVEKTPDAYVFAFSGNGMTPCMQDPYGKSLTRSALADRYAHDVTQTMYLVGSEVPVYWVLAPVPRHAGNAADARVVGDAIERAAGAWPNVTLVDANRIISPDGVWSEALPCLWFEPCLGPVAKGVPSNVVRSPDGAHFCPAGAKPVEGVTPHCDTYSSGAMRYALTMLNAMASLKEAPLRR